MQRPVPDSPHNDFNGRALCQTSLGQTQYIKARYGVSTRCNHLVIDGNVYFDIFIHCPLIGMYINAIQEP